MTTAPEISVIMSAYNAAAYIRDSVASILAQTFTDWELIIVDDGSTDNSNQVIDKYVGKYTDNIRAVFQKNQ